MDAPDNLALGTPARPSEPQASPFANMPRADELAKLFAAALMQTGKYETPEAAIGAAWAAVPAFYSSALFYAEHIAPMFFAALGDDGAQPGNTEALNDRQEGADHGG